MATLDPVIVGTGPGADFATWPLAEAACPADLVAADTLYEMRGQFEEFVTAGIVLTIAGQTTNSSCFVRAMPAPGAGFGDNADKLTNLLGYYPANGCALRCSVGYSTAVVVSSAYSQLVGLQIKAPNDSSGMDITASNVLVSECIIEAFWRNINHTGTVNSTLVQNTLLVKTLAGGSNGYFHNFGSFTLDNVAIVRTSDRATAGQAIYNEYATSTVRNTSVFGFDTFSFATPTVSATNAGSMATVPGSGSLNSLTYADQFEQPNNSGGAADFRTKAGSAQIANGTDLSSSGVTTDIVGSTRAVPYNIGVWQPASTAASFVPQVMVLA